MQEGYKKKKPTKKEAQDMIVKTFEQELKKNHIKGMVQGQEVFAQTILDYINNGKTLDDIKRFCETTLNSKETFEKIIMKENEKENE